MEDKIEDHEWNNCYTLIVNDTKQHLDFHQIINGKQETLHDDIAHVHPHLIVVLKTTTTKMTTKNSNRQDWLYIFNESHFLNTICT